MTPQRLRGGKQDEVTLGDSAQETPAVRRARVSGGSDKAGKRGHGKRPQRGAVCLPRPSRRGLDQDTKGKSPGCQQRLAWEGGVLLLVCAFL